MTSYIYLFLLLSLPCRCATGCTHSWPWTLQCCCVTLGCLCFRTWWHQLPVITSGWCCPLSCPLQTDSCSRTCCPRWQSSGFRSVAATALFLIPQSLNVFLLLLDQVSSIWKHQWNVTRCLFASPLVPVGEQKVISGKCMWGQMLLHFAYSLKAEIPNGPFSYGAFLVLSTTQSTLQYTSHSHTHSYSAALLYHIHRHQSYISVQLLAQGHISMQTGGAAAPEYQSYSCWCWLSKSTFLIKKNVSVKLNRLAYFVFYNYVLHHTPFFSNFDFARIGNSYFPTHENRWLLFMGCF